MVSRTRSRAATAAATLDGVRVLSRLAMLVSARCDESGLTLRQYRILTKLTDKPLRANALARSVGTTRATLSTAIRALELRGLVERSAAEEDGRGVTIRLTGDGRSAMRRAEAALADLVANLSAGGLSVGLLDVLAELEPSIDREATALKARLLKAAG